MINQFTSTRFSIAKEMNMRDGFAQETIWLMAAKQELTSKILWKEDIIDALLACVHSNSVFHAMDITMRRDLW